VIWYGSREVEPTRLASSKPSTAPQPCKIKSLNCEQPSRFVPYSLPSFIILHLKQDHWVLCGFQPLDTYYNHLGIFYEIPKSHPRRQWHNYTGRGLGTNVFLRTISTMWGSSIHEECSETHPIQQEGWSST
jgi:hypothetical protein